MLKKNFIQEHENILKNKVREKSLTVKIKINVKNGGEANFPIAIPKSHWDNANLSIYIHTYMILQVCWGRGMVVEE